MVKTLPFVSRVLFCCTLIFLGTSSCAFAQLKFSAIANESKIGLNDLVQIQYKVENAKAIHSINPPSFTNFTLIGGPNRESGMSSINGNVTTYVALSYILRPRKTGTFTIPPATAVADGKQLKSNSLTVEVVSNGSVSRVPSKPANPFPLFDEPEPDTRVPKSDYVLKPGENADAKIRKNLFVRMVANKTSCYVGEPVVVSFNLYTRLRSETNVTDAPSFNGFSVSDMDVNQEDVTKEKIDGKVFSCYVLRKVQLYPLQPGTFTLTPLVSENNVSFLKNTASAFQGNDLMMQFMQDFGGSVISPDNYIQKSATIKSNGLTITVKPLPVKNVPSNFRGAVGHFTIQTDLQKDQLTTDDAGNLQIKILGKGNFDMVNAPAVNWPDGIDAYDTKVKSDINKQLVPLAGKKIFSIPFTAQKSGNYSIPPVLFSWFNPETGKYEKGKTEPIQFQVSKGKKVLPGDKVKIADNFLTTDTLEWIGGGVLAGGILLAFIFLFFKRRNKESELETQVKLDDLRSMQPQEEELPGNPLSEVHEKLLSEDVEGFYHELKNALEKYLAGKLKIPVHELSREAVMQKFDECNVGIGTTKLFESLMRDVELGLYARRSHVSQMRDLYEKTADLVSLINKQIC